MEPINYPHQGSPALTAVSIDTNPTTVSIAQDEPPTISFTTPQALTKAIGETDGDALFVRDVSVSTFEHLERCMGEKFRFQRYDPADKLLIITIPSRLHEQMHMYLYLEIRDEISGMGLKQYWEPIGTTTFKGRGGGGGQGDSAGGPTNPNEEDEEDKWPTLVVEAGYSMSLASLRQTMRWWFAASDHQVKIVLLVKGDRPSRTLIIEKWQERPQPRRPGATTTRAISHLNPTCTQVINIIRIPGSIHARLPASYNVTRGALRLEFQDLFLRPPGPGEHDVVIGIHELQIIGANVRIGNL